MLFSSRMRAKAALCQGLGMEGVGWREKGGSWFNLITPWRCRSQRCA